MLKEIIVTFILNHDIVRDYRTAHARKDTNNQHDDSHAT